MKEEKLKIDIIPDFFTNKDGTYNKEEAIRRGGHIAGVCYNEEGYKAVAKEDNEKTMKRVNRTLSTGHHSVYDHTNITLDIQNIPKILAMVLNNEKDYATSEKSARYTQVKKKEGSIITDEEEYLYNKWLKIFTTKIKEKYSYAFDDGKIQKLAQENARYFVTAFMPTQMVYTTSLRQFNYLASFMEEYIKEAHTPFEKKLAKYMNDFINSLSDLNILEEDLMKNEKHRKLSLFGKDLNRKEEYYGDVYQTTYTGSIAQLAQAQRHRTLSYELEFLNTEEYFVPPIIKNNLILVEEYINDMERVKDLTPQG